MTIKGYANYGVLAHEKQIIFTAYNPDAHADYADEVEYTIPEGWETAENEAGELLLTLDGKTYYLVHELLSSQGDKPVFVWYDGRTRNQQKLKYRLTGKTGKV